MIRQMIKKGDPIIRINLPSTLVHQLQVQAKQNKRKIQDEFIKRLSLSICQPETLEQLLTQDKSLDSSSNTAEWVKFGQVIPSELKTALENLGQTGNLNLAEIVMLCLSLTFQNPEAFGFNTLSEKILKSGFSTQAAMDECKRKHQGWLYLYEIEKLKLYTRFEKKLPKDVKEQFIMINVNSPIQT